MNLLARQQSLRGRGDEPPPAPPVDLATFSRWAERQEGRYELVRGEVVMMVQVTRRHALVVSRVAASLLRQLDPDRFHLSIAEFGVTTGAGLRFPDLLVDAAGRPLDERATDAPLFVAEVLSPSTIAVDMVEKPAEYGALPSLAAYAVFSQDEPRVWFWERETAGWPDAPRTVEAGTIALPAIGASLLLEEIYRGLGPAS